MPFPSKAVYRLGTYVIFPALAVGGGLLLSRAVSALGLACAAAMLVTALALPVVFGVYCRRCGDGLWAGLARLVVLPIVLIALFSRSGSGIQQGAGFALMGLAVLSFVAAWRLTRRASEQREE